MPLSASVCKRMMGRQTYDNTTIMQCSEMLTGFTTAVIGDALKHPTTILNAAQIAGVNTYDASLNNPADAQMPWASDEYSTNLMQCFMTLFNPSTYVYDNSIQKNFIPDHVKRQVMVAFADAIEANKTIMPDLERALTAVFQSGTSHFPFCPAKASTNIKVVPMAAHSEPDWLHQLRTPLAWREVPFSVDFSASRILRDTYALSETDADRDTRRIAVYLWDAHKKDVLPGPSAYWSCDRMDNAIDVVYLMRSFCADELDTPSLLDATKIHTDLHGAAA